MTIKIEMLTERKVIDVVPGFLRGSSDRVEVDVCLKCGAVVFDFVRHDKWHRDPESGDFAVSDEYAADPEYEYAFRLDGQPEVWSRVFGLPITSLASAKHAGEKSYWESVEYLRHPKGSTRDDDWEAVPEPTGFRPGTREGDET